VSRKYIFIDRDGTLIDEPDDKQVDSLDKLRLKPNVIPALLKLIQAGYRLVMISNQDGLGTNSFPLQDFSAAQDFLISLLQSQAIQFDDILICPHFESDACQCRKPQLGLVMNYLRDGKMNFGNSWVIGDRQTDMQLATNMGIKGILYNAESDWLKIANSILARPRQSSVKRCTNETSIHVAVNLDETDPIQVNTGLGFFDHMLMQLAKHGGFSMQINAEGDLEIDEHHTVEDTALALGEALREALADKCGIKRYGFVLPMDEALATIAIDLSGRSYFVFEGKFAREKVGELPTELISHFFRSLSESLAAAIHIKISGENSHHMIECIFKAVGRSLRQAIMKQGQGIPSTKGVL